MSNGDYNDGKFPVLTNRFVLLGASNLTMHLYTAIKYLQQRIGGPSDVLVAAGHGRSYGGFSQFMFRELPGILSSGLWERLESDNVLPTYAMLTDIGNDIPYGYSPEQILMWVNECVRRLQRQAVCIVITNIPIASIEAMPEWRYNMLRSIIFPNCQLIKDEVVERASVVHRGLLELASKHKIEIIEPSSEWFGMDAIHVRYWKRGVCYQRVTEGFSKSIGSAQHIITEGNSLKLLKWKQRPRFAYKKMLGLERYNPQPSGLLTNGTAVSLY